jgi:hypothetical protein
MERCSCCKAKLGSMRTYGYYVTPWLLVVQRQFCDERCKEAYDAELVRMAKAAQTHAQQQTPGHNLQGKSTDA